MRKPKKMPKLEPDANQVAKSVLETALERGEGKHADSKRPRPPLRPV